MINPETLTLDTETVLTKRREFPLLQKNPQLIYFDNAATTQKPINVLWAEQNWYERHNANPLRGMYQLSAQATAKYEQAREKVADFLGAKKQEIVFTSGATMGLNLLALMLTEKVNSGDEIVLSVLEHHSNLLPWQELARRTGAKLIWVAPDENGDLTAELVANKLSAKTKIVALTGMSNVLGQKIDIGRIAQKVHDNKNITFVVDAAQCIAHDIIKVRELGVDALAFSGHKLYGPMGIGVLYIKEELANQLRPILVGGEMIETVSRDKYVPAPLPQCFEAGTVNAAGAVGLAAALEYLEALGWDNIKAREKMLTEYVIKWLREIPYLRILGSPRAADHAGLVSFVIEGVHAHDVATILASENIAVRAGHHCAAVAHEFLGVPASTRISLGWYNTREEIDRAVGVLASVRRKMGYDE